MNDPLCTCGHARSQHFRITIPFEHYGVCDNDHRTCHCAKFTMMVQVVGPPSCTDCWHQETNHLFLGQRIGHYGGCLIAGCHCVMFTGPRQPGGEDNVAGPVYKDRFDDILKEMSELHTKKGQDYGAANDPYANVRASGAFGIDPWVGSLVRLNDKIVRLQSFIRNGKLANESVEDSIQDIAVYSVIMRILYEEQYGRATTTN